MDRFYENIVFIPCSAIVCFGTSPFFLCLKRLHYYFYFKSTGLCSLTIETRCTSKSVRKVSRVRWLLSPDNALVVKNEMPCWTTVVNLIK